MGRASRLANRRAWALAALAVVLSDARAGSTDPSGSVGSVAPRRAGRPLAVAVEGGRASFDIPSAGAGDRTLVIVSALARAGGPFPIRLEARPCSKPRPVPIARPSSHRSPRLDAPRPSPTPPPVSGLPPARRVFHLLSRGGEVAVASNYRAIEGRLVAVGRRIQVYLDGRDAGTVDAPTLRDLVRTFDDAVYPEAAARFGPALDVDRDGRFTVLFSGELARLAGGKASVDGFVRGADLDARLGEPFGNRCDMMYLSTALRAGPHLRTIVAHEYTHAVTFSRKAASGGAEEEGWLDEGLAHLVEDAHGFSKSNIDYRVSAFLSGPERYRLVVDDYYAADLFRSHGNRGATYLFLRWCVDRQGPGLVDELVRSGRRGVENLEAATGSGFADLFRRWTISLYLSGLDPTAGPDEPYRSIDPRGECEDWILAGPRASSIAPGGPGESWLAGPTTAHYAVIDGSIAGAVEVDVTGPPGAELQVTAVPLSVGWGRPELTVRAVPGPGGEVRVRAEVVELQDTPVRLGALSWEPLTPVDDARAPGRARGGLDMLGIADAFGTSALPAGGGLSSRPIRLPGIQVGGPPLVFKAVGTDARGRRVAAWADLVPLARSDAPGGP